MVVVCFFQTGSSYNSAVDWDIFTKFGTLKVLNLPPNWNRKLIRDVNGRDLDNFHTSKLCCRWSNSYDVWCADAKLDADDDCRLKSKPEVEFQYGGRSFSQNRSSYNSAVDWHIFTNFGTITDTDLLMTRILPNRNRKLIRDVNGRHLENFDNIIITPPMAQLIWNLLCRSKMIYRWE